MVKGFCPRNVKITQFPDGFRLNIYCNCWTIEITVKRQNQSELNLAAVNPQNQKKLTVNRQSYHPIDTLF